MIEEKVLIERVERAHQVRRWYQRMSYGDVITPCHFDDGKTNINSYGEGRWKNYILPLIEGMENELDTFNSTMCDIGCSAGLFLLRGWERFRFRKVLGVEAGKGAYLQLLITKDYYEKLPLFTFNNRIGRAEKNIKDESVNPLEMEKFPIVDLTLMSCVHYHMMDIDLRAYLSKLARKSMYLMVVTDENAGGVISAKSEYLKEIIKWTDRWDLVDVRRTPSPWLNYDGKNRYKNITALLFKSQQLKRLLVDECYDWQTNASEFNKRFYGEVFPEFIEEVEMGKINEDNLEASKCYDWQRKNYHGSTPWNPTIAKERTLSYINIIKTIKEGQQQPIDLNPDNMVDKYDGLHRVAVLKYFGLKYVYGKDVECLDQM